MDSNYLEKKIEDLKKCNDHHNHEMWDIKPEYRWKFNKLELGYKLGHNVGPVPLLPKTSGYYCIRPIYNLTGLGLYARKMYIDVNDVNMMYGLHPGEFWTEWWTGDQYSIDYIWHNGWQPIHAAIGINNDDNLLKFDSWHKVDPPNFKLPSLLNELKDNEILNIEFIDSKIIEVHLRLGNVFGDWLDTDDATTLIPAWKSKYEVEAQQREQDGWKFKKDYDHGFSYIEEPRIGFWYK